MKIIIFGGTKEGREIAEARIGEGCDVLSCVATEYARGLLPPGARCLVRAMDAAEMERVMRAEAPDLVLDATHPFAARATQNIFIAAKRAGVRYERVTRPGSAEAQWRGDAEWVFSAEEAAKALARVPGNALLTTGINTLPVYARAIEKERLYVRVLPCVSSLTVCEACGVLPGHAIAMQGPFTEALNAAIYDMLLIRAIVSKDSGAAGGVPEKVNPALAREIHVIMIGRPKENEQCAERV